MLRKAHAHYSNGELESLSCTVYGVCRQANKDGKGILEEIARAWDCTWCVCAHKSWGLEGGGGRS